MAKWLPLLCCLLTPVLQAEVLQDPTAPLAGQASRKAASEQAAALPRLQSIMSGNGPTLAVLNGRSYQVGQQVEGYTLVAIHSDAVILEQAGKRQTLRLFASKIRS